MTDKKTELMSPNDTPAATPDAGLSRRRLVRAGLSAAPVMAALQSNSVLAGGGSGGNCLRPSTFSSLYIGGPKALMSRDPRAGTSGVCKSPRYWVGRLPRGYDKVMFLANGRLPGDGRGGKDKDRDKDWGNNGNGKSNGHAVSPIKTPFTVNPGRLGNKPYEHATLGDVLASTAIDPHARLARYVAAAYLSHVTRDGWLALHDITDIWQEQGKWKPANEPSWDMHKTLAFFEMVYYNIIPPGQHAA